MTTGGASGLPIGGWQKRLLPELAELAAGDARIHGLHPHGSVLGSGTGIDRWSDLDLVITTEDPISAAEDFARQISNRLSRVFAYSRGGDSFRYNLRLVLCDLRRLDITATVPVGHDMASSSTDAVQEATGAITDLLNSFRFDAVLAAVKAARNDVLIGAHRTLQLARYVLMVAMHLRDRDAGTNHHRFGGTRWDTWVAWLASAPTPYTSTGITAAIRYYTNALENILVEWDPELRPDNRPLFALLKAIDEQDATELIGPPRQGGQER